MTDRVFVTNLCLMGNHGVFPEEKRLGQKFFVDIDCHLDLTAAAASDDYSQAVCYHALCALAQEVSDSEQLNLIDTLASRIAEAVLARHPDVEEVRVAVRKPWAAMPASIDTLGVEVRRRRRLRVAFGIGSNVGDTARNLGLAVAHLQAQDGLEIDAVSKFHTTAPWGKLDQDWFLNACVTGWTEMHPLALMKLCKRIELAIGRLPGERWGPRVIDIDLLHAGDLLINTPELTLPHRDMWNRAFVLEPLVEIAPDLTIRGRRVAEAADRVVQTQV